MTTETIHTCSYSCERPGCIRAQRDELAARLALAQQPAAAGEEIMVKTPNDVLFILPLQPSGLSRGPRFVVHVPLVEAPAVKALQAEIEGLRAEVDGTIRELRIEQADLAAENRRLREALEDIRSRSLADLVMRSDHLELIALLSDIYQIADSEL